MKFNSISHEFETVRSGQSQLTFVIERAGRGKTMLVRVFARQAIFSAH